MSRFQNCRGLWQMTTNEQSFKGYFVHCIELCRSWFLLPTLPTWTKLLCLLLSEFTFCHSSGESIQAIFFTGNFHFVYWSQIHFIGPVQVPTTPFSKYLSSEMASSLYTFILCIVRTSHMAGYSLAEKSLQSCPTLCDPRDGSPPGAPVPGILQARTLEWVTISFSNAWKWKGKVKSLNRLRLLATPWTAAHQAPPSMGFSRQEY